MPLRIGVNLNRSTSIFKFIGLLDTYSTGVISSYSLRKLKSSYSGKCLQVRRSNGNTTQDIGFVNNILDTTSLLSFVGSGDGFVSILYDQSGNNRHLSQSTTANQPQIVLSGSTIRSSTGKPTISFSGSQYLVASYSSMNTGTTLASYTVCSVASGSANNTRIATSSDAVANGDTGSAAYMILCYFQNTKLMAAYRNGLATTPSPSFSANSVDFISNTYVDGTNQNININNGTFATRTNSGTFGINVLSLGATPSGGSAFTGTISEFIWFNTSNSSSNSNIVSAINKYYSIY